MQETDEKPAKKRNKLSMIIVIIVMLLCVETLVGPLDGVRTVSELGYLRRKLPEAKAQWLAHGIQDYSIEVEGSNAFEGCDARLIVRQGELVEVQSHLPTPDPASFRNPPPIPTEQWESTNWTYPECDYEYFTILAFIEDLEGYLKRANPWEDYFMARFDPEWGYITNYEYEARLGFGLIGRWMLPDGWAMYKFSNFQVLTPEE